MGWKVTEENIVLHYSLFDETRKRLIIRQRDEWCADPGDLHVCYLWSSITSYPSLPAEASLRLDDESIRHRNGHVQLL